jgi:hypothetical protein
MADQPPAYEERIAAFIAAKVAEAPPLSDRQRAIIGAAFAAPPAISEREEEQRHAS